MGRRDPPGQAIRPPYAIQDFATDVAVSREILDRLKQYVETLVKWQNAVNLVGANTLSDLWRRHFLDSAQLLDHIPQSGDRPQSLLDVGSGAGFPGMVLAICRADLDVHLVEADSRKSAFLQEVIRLTHSSATVHAARVADVAPFAVDTVTARACAPLGRLLELVHPFLSPTTVCLFHKGVNVEQELTEAHKHWKMRVARIPSRSAASGTVLRLTEVSRRA